MKIIFTILIVRIIDLLLLRDFRQESLENLFWDLLLWLFSTNERYIIRSLKMASAAIFNRDIFLSKSTKYYNLALYLYSSAMQEYKTLSPELLNIELNIE